jgi:hypothetical protein
MKGRKPYWFRKVDPFYGLLYSSTSRGGGSICFLRKENLKAYCGWDHERGRWICRPADDLPRKIIRGTWRSRHWFYTLSRAHR